MLLPLHPLRLFNRLFRWRQRLFRSLLPLLVLLKSSWRKLYGVASVEQMAIRALFVGSVGLRDPKPAIV